MIKTTASLSRAVSVLAISILVLSACSSDLARDAPAMWYVEDNAGNELWLIPSIDNLPVALRPSRLNQRTIGRAFSEPLEQRQPPVSGRLRGKPRPLTWFEHHIRHAFVRADAVMVVPAVEVRIGELTDLAAKVDRSGACHLNQADMTAAEFEQYSAIYEGLQKPYAPRPESAPAGLFVLAMMRASRSQWGVDVGVDDWYVAQAGKEGKSVILLETLSDRRDAIHRALSGEACENQVAAVRALLALGGDGSAGNSMLYESSVEHWQRGDIESYRRELQIQVAQSELLFDALIARRNHLWLPKIIAQMESGQPTIVVVGSAHMAGPDNLPDLLARRGYRVWRVQ